MKLELLVKIGVLALSMQLLSCIRSEVSYSSDIQPILEKNCVECHDHGGEGVAESGFSVRDYDSIIKGTRLGPVVVPGSSMSSALYLVVAQKTAPEIQMPPHHREAWAKGRGSSLSEDNVELIKAWIDQGAQEN